MAKANHAYIFSNRDFIAVLNSDSKEIIPQARLDRLETLLEILEGVPNKQFDINTWGRPDTDCGTVACAAGWGASHVALQKQGLHLVKKKDIVGDYFLEIVYTPKSARDKKVLAARFNGVSTVEHFNACAAFFGLAYKEASFLFDPDSYSESDPSRRRVMKRIRRFIKEASKDRVKLHQRSFNSYTEPSMFKW